MRAYKKFIGYRELVDGSFERIESPLISNPKTKRGRSPLLLRKSDKKHLWTRCKLVRLKTQIMGYSGTFHSMITVTFSWKLSGLDVERSIKKLKRIIKKHHKPFNGDFYGILEGSPPFNKNKKQTPPHYHILSTSKLNKEQSDALLKELKNIGFDSVDYTIITSEDELKLRQYVTKFNDSEHYYKPTCYPYNWKNYKLPTTFKSKGFLKHKINKTISIPTDSLIKKGRRFPFFKVYYRGVKHDLKHIKLNPKRKAISHHKKPKFTLDKKPKKAISFIIILFVFVLLL